MPELLVFGGFRCHVLIPHDVIGALIDDRPTWGGLTFDGAVYRRNGVPVLSLLRTGDENRTRVTVLALREVWLQEPGLSVKVAGEGTWRGVGRNGSWTSPPYPLRQKDAHKSTVHFSRVKTNPDYTLGVEYRGAEVGQRSNPLSGRSTPAVGKEATISAPLHGAPTSLRADESDAIVYRFRSDGGFSKLLDTPALDVPWTHCQVFGQGYELAGVYVDKNLRSVRRWELAGLTPERAAKAFPGVTAPIGQMYFHGWTGGPACVVNEQGREVGSPGNWLLYHEATWRRMRPGDTITQTLTMRRLT